MRGKKLRFKKKFIPLILTGRKKTTIRIKKMCEVGDIIEVLDENDNFISKAIVTNIRVKRYSELTSADAILDGFKDLDELRYILKNIYGYIERNQKLYIYYFKLIK